jgi:REP element-mobilizing transposase RayT
VARQLRDIDAGLFHVWSHSVWTTELFRDNLDHARYITELARTTERAGCGCVALCLLTTHKHLILNVDDGVLPNAMQELNSRYAAGFNARHRLRGHVFGGRFKSRRIEGEADLSRTYRYVARNPVEAGLCGSPEQWPWSSYPGTIGLAEPFTFVDPSLVLGCFSKNPAVAIADLRRFVEVPDDVVLGRRAA